jgi:hypothetical protein
VTTLLDKVADAGGALYAVLTISGYAFLVAPHMPDSLESPEAVVAHLEANPPTAAFWAGIWIEGAGLLALVLFAARIAARVGAQRPGWWLPATGLGVAVGAFAVKVGSFAPGLAALDLDRYDASTVTALLGINDVASEVSGVLDGVFVLVLGLGAAATGVLPRWLTALTLLAGGGLIAASAVAALDSLQLLFLVWLLVLSGWLLARGGRVAAVRSPEPVSA